MHMY